MTKIDYSPLFDKLNNEIINNNDLASAFINRMVNNDNQLPFPVAIDYLLSFLDYFAYEGSLDLSITLSDETIVIDYGRNPIIVDEVYAFYDKDQQYLYEWLNDSVGSSHDLLDDYYIKRYNYINSCRIHNHHLHLFQSLFSVFFRIDFTLDGSLYSLNESDWGAFSKRLPWQFMPHRIDFEDYNPLRNLIILYPQNVTEVKKAFKSISSKKLLFLSTNQIQINLVEKKQKGESKLLDSLKKAIVLPKKQTELADCTTVSFCRLNQRYGGDTYWAVLQGEDTMIPDVSRKLFMADPKTPVYLSTYDSIHVDFAIGLRDDYYKGFEIRYDSDVMNLSSDAMLAFPFYCNAPFVNDKKNPDSIDLDSAFNKWLLCKIPDLYFKQIRRIPSSLLSGTAFSRIIPKVYISEKSPEIKRAFASAILNSEIPFLPSRIGYVRIKESFTNTTEVVGFDDLLMNYLEKKYSRSFSHQLHGTWVGKDLEWLKLPEFSQEDLFSFFKEDLSEKLSIERYSELVYSIYRSIDSDSWRKHFDYYTDLIVRLANSPSIPATDCGFCYPRELIFDNGSADVHVNGCKRLHPSIIKYLEDDKHQYHNSITFREFLNRIGVQELYTGKTHIVDDSHYPRLIRDETIYLSFLINEYNNTIQFLDESGHRIDHLSFIPIEDVSHTQGQEVVRSERLSADGDLWVTYLPIINGQDHRYLWGVLDSNLKIVIPFMEWDSYGSPFKYDEKCNIIQVSDHINNIDRSYIGKLFSTEGKEVFPGDNTVYQGMSIVMTLTNNKRIVFNKGFREPTKQYFILNPDWTIVPFEDAFYGDRNRLGYHIPDGPYYNFFDIGKGLIIADHYDPSSNDYHYTESQVINEEGKVRIPIKEDGEFLFNNENDLFFFNRHHRNGAEAFSSEGEFLFSINSNCLGSAPGIPIINNSSDAFCMIISCPEGNNLLKVSRYYATSKEEKFGLIDKDCRIVFPIVCDSIYQIHDRSQYYRIQINGKFGVFHKSGRITIPPIYDFIKPATSSFVLAITGCTIEENEKKRRVIRGGSKQFVTLEGSVMFNGLRFEKAASNQAQTVWVMKKQLLPDNRLQNGKSGAYLIEGSTPTELVPFEYDYVINKQPPFFVNNGGKVTTSNGKNIIRGGKWGVYDKSLIVDCIFDAITLLGNYYKLHLNGKKGLATREGSIIIPVSYDHIFEPHVSEHLRWVRLNNSGQIDVKKRRIVGGEWQFYSIDSKELSKVLLFDYVGDFSFGLALFGKDGKYGYLDSEFKIKIPNIFDDAKEFNYKGQAKVILDGKRFIIDQQTNQVGEWEEESARDLSDYPDDVSDYSQEDLDRMYREAFDGDPDAQWNIG